ncbi:MAG: hypothetical protein ACJ8CR_32240 [Roseiflexaceae bacterium]
MRRYSLQSLLLLLVLLLGAGAVGGAGRSQAASQPMPEHFFDLTVSLEWQPGMGDLALAGCASSSTTDYLADLKDGLTQTAAYLYSYSAGQLALGNVTVYTGGDHWDSADLRVLASSSYRPSAFIGGIVDVPTQNISATSGMTRTVFYPATIFLGRLWDGGGSRCGAWSQPAGWRTIGHEWAHYALFLYDEYYNVDTNAEQYCTTTGLDLHAMLPTAGGTTDSLMAYHYSADQLWLGGSPPPKADPPPWSCKDTPQARMHGEPDWKTIARFYPVAVPANLRTDIQFAGSPAAAGLNITIPAPAATDTSADVRLAALPAPRLVGEAYLIRPTAKGEPQRIIGQGKIIAGEATPPPFWGVQTATKDRALVVVPNWATGQRYTFPASYSAAPALNVAAPNLLIATASTWRPNISVIPRVVDFGSTSSVTGLIVRLKDCASPSLRPQVVYCPAGGDCSAPAQMNGPDSNGIYEYTFFFGVPGGPAAPPALFGYIYVRNLDPANRAETAIWYQIGGGVGPAIGDGHAPLADSEVDASPAPGASAPRGLDDSRLLYTPAMSCDTAGLIFPAGVLGIAGTPVELQPVVANGNGGQPWNSDPLFGLPPLRVRLGYSQDLLDRLGIGENQLVVLRLRLDKSQRGWEQVPTSAQSRALNWIAAQAQTFAGQGAVYALGYKSGQVWLPLVRR